MLVEKKSLKRFLIVYILSTFLLLGIGSFFYYKMNYQSLISKHTMLMNSTLETFISKNKNTHFLRTKKNPEYANLPVAVYVDGHYYMGNFQPKNIDLKREHYVKDAKLYHINKEHKRWGNIHFVTYVNIGEEIDTLKRNILFFMLFSLVFIVFIAFVLGKIFIRPMKETIESLENFIADATHEINTPISNILINIEMSKELYPQLASTEEYKKIETSAYRLSKIFKDLSFVRLNHAQKKSIVPLEVDTVLKERMIFFNTLMQNKALRVESNIENKVLSIDKEDLIRIIDNLLSNAIKYSPVKGRLFVVLTECLEIHNEGSIKDEKKVLKKYHRENRSEGGFGLGLYIIQKICDRYHFVFHLSTKANKVVAKVCF